jgi:Reverse transcriptase (RNA-dependent DNA polymerase)
MTIQRI